MAVTLTPELENEIRQRVDAGRYPDEAAVLREAFDALDERERLEWLRGALADGEEGAANELTLDRFEAIKRRARRLPWEGEQPAAHAH